MPQKSVFIGGCFIGGRSNTPKEQSTEVSAPQAEDPDVEAHTEDGAQEQASSSDEMKAYKKKRIRCMHFV